MVEAEHRDILKLTLASASLIWYAFLWSLGVLGCLAARKRYRLRPRSPLASAPASSVPGVSILRPLKGLDTNLYENLESTFTQEYNNYEIFFCVDDEDDQALSVVRDLMTKYPSVNAHIAIRNGATVGVNPKVNNLMTAYNQTAHDILWVLDSNVMVDPGTLARSVDILNPPPDAPNPPRRRIGVVHHVPYAWVTKDSSGSRVEEAFLNTNHAKMYIAINTVAVDSCVVGKSCLYRKSDLDRVDGSLKPVPHADAGGCQPGERGLAAFGRFLAEDNMIASALWHELGLRHDLSCDVAKNAVGNMSLMDYVARRIRWVRVRKRMVLAATLAEPFTESVLAGVLAAIGLRYLTGVSPWLFLPVHFLVWLFVDMDVFASLASHPVPANMRWQFLAAWAARELIALPIWFMAIVGSEVEWRGKRYEVMENGEVRRVGEGQGGITGWFLRWGRKTADYYEPLETQE
ncbi:glycosyltransferase family 21 protein [Trametes versicolor FP-101664 SS1]|uniref:glycosyltransferase family 21 protein n=1 Tax=Trametes versicolor (strain FP-101664) TaxID=717944 RepID=UPI000462343A|nr:glycosyltransferase family 21 protein [Trametes versicolor FP-101664 SS1]EIW64263.1 glycosyltransferase family 21 protein [Trametes versicolor FP-101664 SS1]